MREVNLPTELLQRLQKQAQTHSQNVADYLETLLDADATTYPKTLETSVNKQILQQFLDLLPIGALCVNHHHTITFANPSISVLFGYEPDELLGQEIKMLVPDHVAQHHSHHVDDFFKNPSPRIIGNRNNLQGKHKDGTVFHIELGLNYIHIDGSVQALAFISDAQKYKNFEKLLLKNQKALEQAQAQAHLGSWSVNLATGKTYWSDEFFRICGLEPGSVTPSSEVGFTIIHPDDRAKAAAAFEQTQSDGKPYNIEKRIIHPDGQIRWVKSQGEIIIDIDSGEPVLLGTFMDITEMKQAEEDHLRLAMEQQRIKILSDFMQNAAHEFRTPLSIMRSSLFLLRRYDTPEQRDAKAQIINQQIQSIINLVDSLSLMVRLETMTLQETNMTQWPLDSLVNASIDRLQLKMHTQSITVEHQCPKLSVMMYGNDLELAILNILDNACRFSEPDSEITILSGCDDEQMWICIQDQGNGISDEDLPHIFETFWRKDTAHTTPGFGLGLPIARRIIEQHGGHITVKSQVKNGTEVCLYLPVHHKENF